MKKKQLFLIDCSSLFYRSFYAIKHLSNSQGFPTNAIFGFINMLRKIKKNEHPDYMGLIFDAKGPTVRHKEFKDYKAQRKPMPEDLVVQVPVIKKIAKAMNLASFEFQEYEADDVLGSLANKIQEKDLHVVVVTTDKDLLQLVNKTTSIYHPVKEVYLDGDKVKENFGVPPSKVVDVLALWGDASDNIPGVPGIGEKTSKSLIQEFGSVNNLINNLHKVKNLRIKEKIEQSLDQLKQSYRLVEIRKDVDIHFSLEDFMLAEPNLNELIPLLQELEFSSLLSEYTSQQEEDKQDYKTILNEDELKKLIARIKKEKHVSIDTETDSPFPTQAHLVGISFSTSPHHAHYLPLCHDYPGAPQQIPKKKALDLLKEILSDPKIKKTGHNIKYDDIVLKREGQEIQGIDSDTMLLSYLLEPTWGQHNLDKLASIYLHRKTIAYEDVTGKGKNQITINAVDIEKVTPYACQDADFAYQLSSLLKPKVHKAGLEPLYRDIERPLIKVLASMEMAGVKIDKDVLKNISFELKVELQHLKKKIYQHSGVEFNLNSPQQLGEVLFNKLKLPATKKTKKTRQFSTGMDILNELALSYPIAKYILEYRKLGKLKSTYADSLPKLINPETNRIHTSYNQTVTATGRLSSSDPNLQNIPVRGKLGVRFRQAFIPEKGCFLLSADYSQIELRVLAHLSNDPALIKTFLDDQDVHKETAQRIFGDTLFLSEEEQRRRAKIINFSVIYGASAFSLARELGVSNSEAQKFIDLYYEKYPRVKEYLEGKVKEAQEKGFSETLFGRRRQVPELIHNNKQTHQAGRRIALNAPIQGTAADLIKKAMIDIWEHNSQKKLQSKMILQVHDELVFEVPDNELDQLEAIVKEGMENVFPLKVPLKVNMNFGINWAETK